MAPALIVTALFMVFLASCAVTAWFFLRPGGVLDNGAKSMSAQVASLQDSSSEHSSKLLEMALKMKKIELDMEQFEASLKGRISSFEARYGKFAKKEEQEHLREEAFAAIRTLNNQGG